MSIELVINDDQPDLVEFIRPISCGPYAGHDWLYAVDDLKGKFNIRRHKQDGTLVKDYGLVPESEVVDKLQSLIVEQGNNDCNVVTGNGRWGCE